MKKYLFAFGAIGALSGVTNGMNCLTKNAETETFTLKQINYNDENLLILALNHNSTVGTTAILRAIELEAIETLPKNIQIQIFTQANTNGYNSLILARDKEGATLLFNLYEKLGIVTNMQNKN